MSFLLFFSFSSFPILPRRFRLSSGFNTLIFTGYRFSAFCQQNSSSPFGLTVIPFGYPFFNKVCLQ